MERRGYLVHLRTITTTRSAGAFEAVRLEKNETRKGDFLGRESPPIASFFFFNFYNTRLLVFRFLFAFSVALAPCLERGIASAIRGWQLAAGSWQLTGPGPHSARHCRTPGPAGSAALCFLLCTATPTPSHLQLPGGTNDIILGNKPPARPVAVVGHHVATGGRR
jgi:hypothetical protein